MGQIGHVDDQSKAMRMMMANPRTFGKRYNITGKDYYTDEGYVDAFVSVVGVEPQKVFIPANLMDNIWLDRVKLEGTPVQIRAPWRIRSAGRSCAWTPGPRSPTRAAATFWTISWALRPAIRPSSRVVSAS